MDINRDAPVVASVESLIRAPLGSVWEVLTDLAHWDRWNPEVGYVRYQGPLAAGTEFRWKADGAPIVSTIREVVPERRLVWTGRLLSIRAVHLWSFDEQEDGVLARTEESFDGLLVRLFRGPLQRMLESSLNRGMAAFKAECERRAAV
jgi:hypothetical protein